MLCSRFVIGIYVFMLFLKVHYSHSISLYKFVEGSHDVVKTLDLIEGDGVNTLWFMCEVMSDIESMSAVWSNTTKGS